MDFLFIFLLTAGIRERYNDLLKILCSCMSRLLSIVCKGRYA